MELNWSVNNIMLVVLLANNEQSAAEGGQVVFSLVL